MENLKQKESRKRKQQLVSGEDFMAMRESRRISYTEAVEAFSRMCQRRDRNVVDHSASIPKGYTTYRLVKQGGMFCVCDGVYQGDREDAEALERYGWMEKMWDKTVSPRRSSDALIRMTLYKYVGEQ